MYEDQIALTHPFRKDRPLGDVVDGLKAEGFMTQDAVCRGYLYTTATGSLQECQLDQVLPPADLSKVELKLDVIPEIYRNCDETQVRLVRVNRIQQGRNTVRFVGIVFFPLLSGELLPQLAERLKTCGQGGTVAYEVDGVSHELTGTDVPFDIVGKDAVLVVRQPLHQTIQRVARS
jgi:hypothetical protein